ncbi:WGxxGxxG family protein [Lederbergia wuyishanensis]|uniref:MYXO-CTERM domain-containing protein n=1 Tax=Lederbergia wuyishanensis TaxID=1347903 RepID=A0ABU0D7M4_9BACI|nr:WGxxGxxG family protein [Lederbergia wuyishanensis]MCJ8009034.1 WGxxGxxG-CTERM domain-containing protein [Lederbergia wuyishanensis]MDQ0344368.1 hypothetical protein [Lederbergia wuyishanensis]
MLNKLLYSACALLISTFLIGVSNGHAQTPITETNNIFSSSEVTHIAQNDDVTDNDANDDNDTDWGWIGLVGLAGLLGLRRNDKK